MKKVIIYGAGGNYIDFAPWIKERYEIVALVDGDQSKWGKKQEGVKIESPDVITEHDYDFLIVTPTDGESIANYLKSEYSLSFSKIELLETLVYGLKKDKHISVCFLIVGGLGDAIINYNYIYAFYDKFSEVGLSIDIANASNAFISFVENSEFVHSFIDVDFEKTDYDLVFELRRYPRIIRAEFFHIASAAPKLMDYLTSCRKFEYDNPNRIHFGPKYDGYNEETKAELCEKRYLQPDIYGEFGLTESYLPYIKVDSNLLSSFSLDESKYITIHRGCDRFFFSDNNVKLWPEKNYEELMVLIKKKYPDYKIVLLGEDYEKSDLIHHYDLDLLGKTNMPQLKAIIKGAALHIDTEGGLVHMRHSLKSGKSVVLFGPTSDDFFGYPENINIRTSDCPYPCEWKTKDWAVNCSNSEAKHICMESISPQMIIQQIEEAGVL